MIIYGESDKVLIREMQEADYEIYYGMNQISLEIKDTLDEEQIKKIWRNIVDKEFTCVIIEKETSQICGFCSLQKPNTSTPEIGMDIFEEYSGRGYAQEAARLLIKYGTEIFKPDYFIWKADGNNKVSCHIAEKLGGKFVGMTSVFPENVIEEMVGYGVIKSKDEMYNVRKYKIEIAN